MRATDVTIQYTKSHVKSMYMDSYGVRLNDEQWETLRQLDYYLLQLRGLIDDDPYIGNNGSYKAKGWRHRAAERLERRHNEFLVRIHEICEFLFGLKQTFDIAFLIRAFRLGERHPLTKRDVWKTKL